MPQNKNVTFKVTSSGNLDITITFIDNNLEPVTSLEGVSAMLIFPSGDKGIFKSEVGKLTTSISNAEIGEYIVKFISKPNTWTPKITTKTSLFESYDDSNNSWLSDEDGYYEDDYNNEFDW